MFTPEDNRVLDEIMRARRSCRAFSDRLPSKEDVAAVIEAGRMAPYAIYSAKDVDIFRHYYVLWRGNPLLKEIDRQIRVQSQLDIDALEEKMAGDPILEEYGPGLIRMWRHRVEHGVPGFPDPPCLVVIAEWRGARRAEFQDMAHTLQNMWLKATALNLDFNMISTIESMIHNRAFCDLFGLPVGQYGFHACILGYRETPRLASPPMTDRVHWL